MLTPSTFPAPEVRLVCYIEFSLNDFREIHPKSATKSQKSKRIRSGHLSCGKGDLGHSNNKSHVIDSIFK